MGDPRLREVSIAVSQFDTDELHKLVEDMFDTMAEADGAGLAAPQIGVLKRVMVFGVDHNPRYPDASPVPVTVLVNPQFEVVSKERVGEWEGCLSVPGMRGYVERPGAIRYRGYDQFGHEITRDAVGFHATVFQHEFDHLNGVLYPDLIEDPSMFGFTEELAAGGFFGELDIPPED